MGGQREGKCWYVMRWLHVQQSVREGDTAYYRQRMEWTAADVITVLLSNEYCHV